MASFTLKNEAVFPVGTSVTAYPQSNWPMARRPPSGAPIGAAAETQVVGAGGAAFAALADATNYYAYAPSPDRYVAFRTSVAAAASGGTTTPQVVLSDERAIAGRPGVAETFSRVGNTLASGNLAPTGQLRLAGFMIFKASQAVTSLACVSGSTAAVTPTNQWFCLVRVSDMTVVAVTTDDTTAAWAAQTPKTLNIAGGPWTPTQTERCYFGIVVVAATLPNAYGVGMGNQAVQAVPPFVCGASTTGFTGPAAVGTVVATPVSTTAIHNIWAWAN